jgi:carboxyl-terminal processing protease
VFSPLQRLIDFLKRPGVNNRLALISLIMILTFAVGDFVGQSRIRTPVDEAIQKVLTKGDRPVEKSILQRAAIEAVLKASGDQWANYFPKSGVKSFQQSLQGRYSGIGIWLRKNSSGVLEVSSIQKGSPAAIAGIKVLDSLVDINGNSMDGASVATAVAALRGKADSKVQLQLERNQKPFRISVQRESVLNEDVSANQIAPGISYIQLSAINSQAAIDIRIALNKYNHGKGIILDLRDNPGGVLSNAVEIASQFLGDGLVVSYSRKGESDVVINSTNPNPVTSPMVVLVNRSTASSAEAIAGAMQDRNRAVIIGEKSYGKGTVQEILTLSDGSQMEITVGKYRTPSGRIIDQVGITPDLLVPETEDITKSLQVLGGLASIEEVGKVKK